MKRSAFSLLVGIWIFTASVTLFSFEWPIQDPNIISTFGSPEGTSYKKGVDISSSNDTVTPIEGGELILHADAESNGVHDIPSPMGNMVVLQHERGIRSVYGHLQTPVAAEVPYYDVGDPLGKVGSSGIVNGQFLLLGIIDSEVDRFVNPLLSLPSLTDTSGPQLNRVELHSDERSFVLEDNKVIPQDKYQVLIDAYDVSPALESLQRMAPYSIKVYVNGEEQVTIDFESIAVSDWTAVPTTSLSVSAAELYANEWSYRLNSVTLQPGEAVIEIFVNDFAGNEAARSYRLQVTSR